MTDTTDPTAGEPTPARTSGDSIDLLAALQKSVTAAKAAHPIPRATPDAGDVAWQMLAGVRCQAVHAQIVGAWCVNCESWARTIGEPFWRPSLAALLDAARRAGGDERAEQIAQAIEAGVLPSHPNSGYKDGFARAARIARESR